MKRKNAWKTDDKQWMKARKASWKPIKKELVRVDEMKREDVKMLQDYYLFGKMPDIPPEHYYFENFNMIFRLWFHPDQSEENWISIIKATDDSDFKRSQGIFMSETGTWVKHLNAFGFMGGIEPRMADVFFPDQQTIDSFAAKGVSLPEFIFGNRFGSWTMDARSWLIGHAAPSRSWVEFTARYIWDAFHRADPKYFHWEIGSNNPVVWALQRIICQCANYVEPRGMPGEDTPQRRLAEYLKEGLNSRQLPPDLQELWERILSRSGRNFWMKFDLTQAEGLDSADKEGYATFVCHSSSLRPSLIPLLNDIFKQLGFTREGFDRSRATTVDIGRHLTDPMIKRLGYRSGQPIPAYRYRIHTNDTYTDEDTARVHADLLLPVPHASLKPEPTTPMLLWVPRPNGTFAVQGSMAYELNERMVRRLFTVNTKMELQRYFNAQIPYRKDEIAFHRKDPFYDADYQPMVSYRMPIVDRPEDDFPTWRGDPLPQLFD